MIVAVILGVAFLQSLRCKTLDYLGTPPALSYRSHRVVQCSRQRSLVKQCGLLSGV